MYDWELKTQTSSIGKLLTDTECEDLVSTISFDFSVSKPSLVLKPSTLFNCYYRETREIVLAPYGKNQHVIMHEMAHHITYQNHTEIADHGPEFVGILFKLIQRYTDQRLQHLVSSAAPFRLKFNLAQQLAS